MLTQFARLFLGGILLAAAVFQSFANQAPAEKHSVPRCAAFGDMNQPAKNDLRSATQLSTPVPTVHPPITSAGRATIVVRVVNQSGSPLSRQAVVQLFSNSADAPLLKATEQPAHTAFDVLQDHTYTVKASAAGYQTAQATLRTFPRDTYYQAVLYMREVPQSIVAGSSKTSDSCSNPHVIAGSSSTSAKRLLIRSSMSWRPPGVDQEKLPVAQGIACPVATIFDRVQQNVSGFVTDLNRIDAVEHVFHQQLTSSGKVISTERRKFDYLVSINHLPSGVLDLNETRDSGEDYDDFPAHIATLGLPTLELVFYHQYIGDNQFECEGLGDWNGEATWLVHFQQRLGVVPRLRGYVVNNVLYPVSLEGRAWIAADSFQIVHIEADLMDPLPQIQLRYDHQSVDYRPVFFETCDCEVWLPDRASLYFDFRHHKYHRVHTFGSYLLFSVRATEKISPPEGAASKTR